jgi:CBS domain containing-hemolysin-like protein
MANESAPSTVPWMPEVPCNSKSQGAGDCPLSGLGQGAGALISSYNLRCGGSAFTASRPVSLRRQSLEDDPFPSLLPAGLVLAGALFGGVHALLGSPLRANLLAAPAARWRERSEQLLASSDGTCVAARVLRASCVVGAAVLAVFHLIHDDGTVLWLHVAGLLAFSVLVLELIPAQVLRGQLLGLMLLLFPIPRALASVGSGIAASVRRVLRRETPNSNLPNERARAGLRAGQLLALAHAHQGNERLGDAELKMIGRMLDLPETDAAEVMTPRTAITAVSAETSVAQAIDCAAIDGHSRLPVFDGDLDHVLGIFHIKDVLALITQEASTALSSVREHMRPALNVPETVRLPALLEKMQSEREHLAVVVDEYGGTAGVVTIEDLLEEIVGDIQDEHDSEADQPQVYSSSKEEIIADGAYSIFDLNEDYEIALPEDESYETLAGLIFDRLGHIPSAGEVLELHGARLVVLEADDRRVQRVRIERVQPEDLEPESDAA